MATVIQDTVRDIEIREDEGAVVFLRRTLMIHGLTSGSINIFREASNTPGVPLAGSVHPIYDNAILKERNFSLVQQDPTKVNVELTYVGLGIDEQVGFFVPRTSLKQATSQNDRFGNQITVQHTFPADHEAFPSQTITQGVEISALRPISEIQRTIKLSLSNATAFAQEWVGSINNVSWGGDPAGTWLCTNVSTRLMDGVNNPPIHKVTFSFQYDPLGHNPFVVFIDPTTGRPPPSIVSGTGDKTIDWYKPKNFNRSWWAIV